MVREYPISFQQTQIGTALVERQGLYYRIECQCKTAKENPSRIQVTGPMNSVDLGICVPMDTGYGLISRIPIKQIGEGELLFRVRERKQKPSGEFVPISADQPTVCLAKLQSALLEERDGQIGLLLTDRSEVPQDSGLNPLHPNK